MSTIKVIATITSNVFPTYSGKIHGTVFILILFNLISVGSISLAVFFPATRTLFICIGIGLILLAILSGFSFIEMLKTSREEVTEEIVSLFSNIQSGKADLSKIERHLRTPDAQKINQSYSTFLDTIRKLIDEIRKIGIDIAVDSTQVAASVFNTADKTAKQSELSEIVSTASNEANSAIAEVSENAQYVSEKTTNNLDMARKSYKELVDVTQKICLINKTVHSFIDTVANLGKSSANILDIVNIINGISEQTNLLSLNATIEAARAGEHGKGFAVVAEEVRDLARRIKPATEKITDNINSMISIVEETQSGTAEILRYSKETDMVVGQATENFRKMITDFEVTDEQLLKIASAIEELSTNNNEMTVKVESINSLSRNIAEEMSKSEDRVSALNRVTEKMLEMVSAFKTGDGQFDSLISKAQAVRSFYEEKIEELKAKGINVFDTNYQKVMNTVPHKFTTSFTNAFIKDMIPHYESAKKEIPNSIYVLAIDRKGYLPAHHEAFSKPMTGNPEQDLIYSRHQRIFLSNNSEKRRCSHTNSMLLQTYMRDTGQILNDLSMPIYIDGQHWGALIIGFDPKVMFTD